MDIAIGIFFPDGVSEDWSPGLLFEGGRSSDIVPCEEMAPSFWVENPNFTLRQEIAWRIHTYSHFPSYNPVKLILTLFIDLIQEDLEI